MTSTRPRFLNSTKPWILGHELKNCVPPGLPCLPPFETSPCPLESNCYHKSHQLLIHRGCSVGRGSETTCLARGTVGGGIVVLSAIRPIDAAVRSREEADNPRHPRRAVSGDGTQHARDVSE